MELINTELFESRLQEYEKLDYNNDFNGFWKWKLRVETGNGHILDKNHIKETYNRFYSILPRWLTYRPYDSKICLGILRESLENISKAYDQIRSLSLLEFDQIPLDPLQLIWGELGRAKETGGETRVHTEGITLLRLPNL